MPSLQVREMPSRLYGAIVEEANREHRSLAQQAIVVMQRGLRVDDRAAERRKELMERIRRRQAADKWKPGKQPSELVAEDRGR